MDALELIIYEDLQNKALISSVCVVLNRFKYKKYKHCVAVGLFTTADRCRRIESVKLLPVQLTDLVLSFLLFLPNSERAATTG